MIRSMNDLTPVLNAAIALLAALISAFAIPWLRSRTSGQEREALLKWAEIAVAAAQQLYYTLDGEQRKEFVKDFLRDRGYDVSREEVDSAIEAAVLKLHRELEKA